jgi:multidrug efflux pump subunit AcrA (membrane-fusion protein)
MIDAGQVIMEVEGAPVFLLQGDLPLWRVVGPGVTGLDVENLRQSLERVGIAAGSGQTYDATLSAAIAALYTNAGYAEPVALAEDQAIQESAREAVQQAQSAVQQAQAALSAAQNARPSESDLLTAQQSIDQAKVVLSMAQQGVCTANGNQVPCTPEIIAYYQNAVNLAVAQYQQLSAPPDTSAQQQAVNQAQEALNQAQTAYNQTLQNTAGPQNILIVPEPKIRIDEVDATVGQPATGEVLTWTKTILYGEAPLTAAQQRMLTTGTQAVLEWGDGSTMTGSVAEITDSSRDSLTGQETPATVRVDVTDQAKLAEHGPSAVTLSFIEDEAEDTLIVPVTALVVPAEGGYCVERPDGSYVRVEIGLVADTRVQVFSDQLREGDLVVTP